MEKKKKLNLLTKRENRLLGKKKRKRGEDKIITMLGSLALVLTNLAIMPASIVAIYFKDLPTFTFTVIMFLISSFYHLCLADFWCVAPLRLLQACDHLSVYSIIVWLFLLIMFEGIEIQISLFVVILVTLLVMIPFLLNSLVVEVSVGLFILFASLGQIMVFKKQVKPFDIIFAVIVALIFGSAGAMYAVGSDVDSNTYKILHPIWHVLAMFGLIPLLFLAYGVSISDVWFWCTSQNKKRK